METLAAATNEHEGQPSFPEVCSGGPICRWATECSIIGTTPEFVLERLDAIRREIYRIQRDDVYVSSAAYEALGNIKRELDAVRDDIRENPPEPRQD